MAAAIVLRDGENAGIDDTDLAAFRHLRSASRPKSRKSNAVVERPRAYPQPPADRPRKRTPERAIGEKMNSSFLGRLANASGFHSGNSWLTPHAGCAPSNRRATPCRTRRKCRRRRPAEISAIGLEPSESEYRANSLRKIPKIAGLDIGHEGFSFVIDASDARLAVKHDRPFRRRVPVQLADSARFQPHIHAGDGFRDRQFTHRHFARPAAFVKPLVSQGKRIFRRSPPNRRRNPAATSSPGSRLPSGRWLGRPEGPPTRRVSSAFSWAAAVAIDTPAAAATAPTKSRRVKLLIGSPHPVNPVHPVKNPLSMEARFIHVPSAGPHPTANVFVSHDERRSRLRCAN